MQVHLPSCFCQRPRLHYITACDRLRPTKSLGLIVLLCTEGEVGRKKDGHKTRSTEQMEDGSPARLFVTVVFMRIVKVQF